MKPNDVTKWIAQGDPAAHSPGLEPDRAQWMMQAIPAQVAADTSARTESEPAFARAQKGEGAYQTPSFMSRKLKLGFVAAVAAGALIAVPIFMPSGENGAPAGLPSADAAAVKFLNEAADLAEKAKDPEIKPGQFWKYETQTGEPAGTDEEPSTKNSFMNFYEPASRDGHQWVVSSETKDGFNKGKFSVVVTEMTDQSNYADTADHFFTHAPRDVEGLRDYLFKQAEEDSKKFLVYDGADFSTSPPPGVTPSGTTKSSASLVMKNVADVLRSGSTPASWRASLYRVLATVEGVKIVRNVTLNDGTKGTTIGYEDKVDDELIEILIDPANGEFIGERYSYTDNPKNLPLVEDFHTIKRTVVDEIPQHILDAPHAMSYDENAPLISCKPGKGQPDGTCSQG